MMRKSGHLVPEKTVNPTHQGRQAAVTWGQGIAKIYWGPSEEVLWMTQRISLDPEGQGEVTGQEAPGDHL